MKPRRIAIPAAVIGGLLVCLSAFSHHATATEYDIAQTITFKGVIAKVEWSNPHIHVQMDVKAGNGTESGIENWDVEFGSPGAVIVAGLSRDSLKPGTILAIKGYPGKSAPAANKPRRACATEVTLPDGLTTRFVVGI